LFGTRGLLGWKKGNWEGVEGGEGYPSFHNAGFLDLKKSEKRVEKKQPTTRREEKSGRRKPHLVKGGERERENSILPVETGRRCKYNKRGNRGKKSGSRWISLQFQTDGKG